MVDDVVDELGTREEIEYIRKILREGTSADRQIRKFQETGSLESVVDMLVEETSAGI
jgi:carboxylate-amine ligase